MIDKAHQGAAEMMRPIARKYDLDEHAYPVELDTLAEPVRRSIRIQHRRTSPEPTRFAAAKATDANLNGANMAAVLNALEACWGDAA